MKLEVAPEFPYGLKLYNTEQIKEIGLKILHVIETSEIEYGTDALSEFFKDIEDNCKDSHVWVLYGSNDNENWIPFQAASKSSESVISEIKTDFNCMTSYDENKDLKNWNSYFYNSVMEIKYGFDARCQKYQKMKEMCKYIAVAILIDESALVEPKGGMISKYQKKECDIALEIKPLFWNPAGNEFTYIRRCYNIN